MATTTNNLNLTKPASGESYNLDVVNQNTQKIDDFAGVVNTNLSKLNTAAAYASNQNLDNYTTTGSYHVGTDTSSSPTGAVIYGILVVYSAHDTIAQTFIRIDNMVYTRVKANASSSWSGWQDITQPITRAGIANYSGLKGGGWSDRVTIPVTFSSPMPGTSYDVFAVVAGAYADFPYISCTPDGSANTVNGTSIILVNTSGSTTAVSGSIYWFAVMRH